MLKDSSDTAKSFSGNEIVQNTEYRSLHSTYRLKRHLVFVTNAGRKDTMKLSVAKMHKLSRSVLNQES